MALSANHRGFREHYYRGSAYSFVKGATTRAGMPGSIEELPMQLGKHDIHIIPAARGNKSQKGAIGKIIIGAVMIAAAVMTAGAALGAGAAAGSSLGGASAAGGAAGAMGAAVLPGVPLLGAITYGSITSTGAMMALSGVAGLIAQTPQASSQLSNRFERPDARTSFVYNGPVNTVEQGGPSPSSMGACASAPPSCPPASLPTRSRVHRRPASPTSPRGRPSRPGSCRTSRRYRLSFTF